MNKKLVVIVFLLLLSFQIVVADIDFTLVDDSSFELHGETETILSDAWINRPWAESPGHEYYDWNRSIENPTQGTHSAYVFQENYGSTTLYSREQFVPGDEFKVDYNCTAVQGYVGCPPEVGDLYFLVGNHETLGDGNFVCNNGLSEESGTAEFTATADGNLSITGTVAVAGTCKIKMWIDNIRVKKVSGLVILSPISNQSFVPNQAMIIKFIARSEDSNYLSISHIDYKLDSAASWSTIVVTGHGLYSFTKNAPSNAGNHTLSIRYILGSGEILTDSIIYEVASIDLSIIDIKPIQVIEDVNLVAGKATVVKVIARNNSDVNSLITVKLTYNGEEYPLTATFSGDYNYFFIDGIVPYSSSGIKNISAEIDPDNSITETNETNNTLNKDVPVVATKGIKIVFRPVDFAKGELSEDQFKEYVKDQMDYIVGTYPVKRSNFEIVENFTMYENPFGMFDVSFVGPMLLSSSLFISEVLAHGSAANHVVGIIPNDWLKSRGYPTYEGLAYKGIPLTAVLVEGDWETISAHEIGHNYNLCDEYNGYCGNCILGIGVGCGNCPNKYGENCSFSCNSDTCDGEPGLNGYWLDKENPEPIENAFCFMGTADQNPKERWVSKDVYNHLLSELKITLGAESESDIILLSGTVMEGLAVTLDTAYLVTGETFGSSVGNCAVRTLDLNDTKISDYNFSTYFGVYGDPPMDVNYSPFSLAIPYSVDVNKVQIVCDGEVKAERQLSSNAPTVSIISPTAGVIWSDTNNITWTANDLDGGDLNFVVQFSSDNGLNWNPLAIGVSDENYLFDVGMIEGGTEYKIKVIVTDGVLIGEDISDTFTIKNPNIAMNPTSWDLNIVSNFEDVLQDFNIVNSGNDDLNVFDVSFSDNVSIEGLNLPIVLGPSEQTSFTATLHAPEMSVGEFSKDINLFSNDPNQTLKIIKIEGTLEEATFIALVDVNVTPITKIGEVFSVNAFIENQGNAPLLDANATIILPNGLTTEDTLSQFIGDLNVGQSTTLQWDVNSNQANLYNITINVQALNGLDTDGSASISVRDIDLEELELKSSFYPDENVLIDVNAINNNALMSYAGLYVRTVFTDSEDQNHAIDTNITVLSASEVEAVTINWGEYKLLGEYAVNVTLYDELGEALDSKNSSFEVVPYIGAIESFYSWDGLTFGKEIQFRADMFSSAANDLNETMIVGSYEGDMNYTIRNPLTQTWSTPSFIGSGTQPYLISDGSNYHLVFIDSNKAYYRNYVDSWSEATQVSVLNAEDPVIVIDGSDLYVVFTTDEYGSTTKLALAGYNGSWGNPVQLTGCTYSNCGDAKVLDKIVNGKIHYAYRRYSSEEYGDPVYSALMYSNLVVNSYWGAQ